jgi:hypothetical protein
VLQSQIEQLESQLQEEFTGRLEELTAEFTERLGDTEQRLSATARERDTLREQLKVATARFSDKIGQADKLQSEIMAEKDAKIEGLMTEGQKLQTKLHEVCVCVCVCVCVSWSSVVALALASVPQWPLVVVLALTFLISSGRSVTRRHLSQPGTNIYFQLSPAIASPRHPTLCVWPAFSLNCAISHRLHCTGS